MLLATVGLRGPQPAPTKLKVLRGEKRSRINFHEPPAPPGLPAIPAEASKKVRDIWAEKMLQLRAMGLAHSCDQELLYAYCVMCALFQRDTELLNSSDVLIRTPNGPARNPVLVALRDHAHLMLVLGREFGFSPSARSQIRNPGNEHQDPAERLLG